MTEHEHRMQCAIAYIGELQRRAKAHRYSTAGEYELALEALRSQAERSRGCEYCLGEYPTPIVNLEITTDDVDEENVKLEFAEPLRFCPMCGRPLKGGE